MKVGIDLGTTYSLIAKLKVDGVPVLLPDQSFKTKSSTPSAVWLGANNALVGWQAEGKLDQDPSASIIRFFKRSFGLKDPIAFDGVGNPWHPEGITALVLQKLKADLESGGDRLSGAVLTVPAHFNDVERKSLLHAALFADIPVIGLIDEPVAAAMHYGSHLASKEGAIFVYDLGGGTLDTTVISHDSNGFYVHAKNGHSNIGGKEFDEAIMEFIIVQIDKSTGGKFDWSAYHLLLLRRIAEEIKIELSLPQNAFLQKQIILGSWSGSLIFNRQQFESKIKIAIEETIEVARKCITESGLKPRNLNALLLVGGSSMIPYVSKMLSEKLEIPLEKILQHNPLQAVAYGAALRAAQVSGEGANLISLPPEFRGISGYFVGVRTLNPRTGAVEIDTLILKNVPLPARASRVYYTSNNDQDKIRIELVQFMGNSEEPISIGEVEIGPIPHARANYSIELNVEYTNNGVIQVRAYDPQTGQELRQSFSNQTEENNLLFQQRKVFKGMIINNII